VGDELLAQIHALEDGRQVRHHLEQLSPYQPPHPGQRQQDEEEDGQGGQGRAHGRVSLDPPGQEVLDR
jgi:hypothetical protein